MKLLRASALMILFFTGALTDAPPDDHHGVREKVSDTSDIDLIIADRRSVTTRIQHAYQGQTQWTK